MADQTSHILKVIEGYKAAANSLIPAYDHLAAQDVLQPVSAFLPRAGHRVLDVGAGTGAVAAWLASKGCQVTAVEPVAAFRDHARQAYANLSIRWLDDRLPVLNSLAEDMVKFDCILAIAVLHHLASQDQNASLSTFARLLVPNGRLILSLRHGACPADRPGFDISVASLIKAGEDAGFCVRHLSHTSSIQDANRHAGITWTWIVFERLEHPILDC
ncbi:MAG: class I SAM-dependent methyltransferase [Pseudomonadota bacterium]